MTTDREKRKVLRVWLENQLGAIYLHASSYADKEGISYGEVASLIDEELSSRGDSYQDWVEDNWKEWIEE